MQRLISPSSKGSWPRVRLRLEGDLAKLTPEERKTLEGKDHLSSDDPLIRKAQFRLSEITYFFLQAKRIPPSKSSDGP